MYHQCLCATAPLGCNAFAFWMMPFFPARLTDRGLVSRQLDEDVLASWQPVSRRCLYRAGHSLISATLRLVTMSSYSLWMNAYAGGPSRPRRKFSIAPRSAEMISATASNFLSRPGRAYGVASLVA